MRSLLSQILKLFLKAKILTDIPGTLRTISDKKAHTHAISMI